MKTSLFFFTFAAGFWLLNLIIRWNYIWDYNEWYCGRSCCVPISVSAAYWHSSKDTHTSAFDQIDIRNPDYVKAKHSKISGKNILLLTPFLLCCICVEFSPTPLGDILSQGQIVPLHYAPPRRHIVPTDAPSPVTFCPTFSIWIPIPWAKLARISGISWIYLGQFLGISPAYM